MEGNDMARFQRTDSGTRVWLSASDTYNWATRPGAAWPCSQCRGLPIYAEFDSRGDLVDFRLNGKDADMDATELSAICSDFLRSKFGADHPAIR